MEIAPQHASDGWLMTVVVEDEAGPHLLDKRPLAARLISSIEANRHGQEQTARDLSGLNTAAAEFGNGDPYEGDSAQAGGAGRAKHRLPAD